MENYRKFTISSIPYQPDLLGAYIWDLNPEGVEDRDFQLEVYSSQSSGLTSRSIEAVLQPLADQGLIESFRIDEVEVENRNWNEEWEKNATVVEVTPRIVIKPTFREYEASSDQVVILIDPKMSFGTGGHETTSLMLQLMERYITDGMRALDVGSGTGILAIAAVKLGAEYALGIDNDSWCLLNGRENVLLNELHDKVDIIQGELEQLDDSTYDLILANIQKNVLLSIQNGLAARLAPGGNLLLSGLLETDYEAVKSAYTATGLVFREVVQQGDWIAIAFSREELE